ncbi:MAG TPA: sugar ABC transporter permease [Treponemataceae bacterium]|nr:sugar ABC transporter permease [Treponemataceae bacterium]
MIKKTKKVLHKVLPLLVLLPAFFLMFIFLFVPLIVTLQYSLTNMSLLGQSNNYVSFIGLDNYIRLFTSGVFYRSLANTFLLILFSAILGQQLLGGVIAYLLQKTNYVFRKFIRFSLTMGWLLPDIVVAFLFFYMFSAEGLVNFVLFSRNISGISWLFTFGLPILLIADIWSNTAFSVTTYEGFFSSLHREWYEAAAIDGASSFSMCINITIPLIIKPALSNILFCILRTVGIFSLVFLLTGGGPANSTNVISLYIYQNSIAVSSIGYGAAIGFVTFIIVTIISQAFVTVNKARDELYE